jgi:hypothetical protein
MDYSKSVIYTIQKDEFIYVGSTTNFRCRKSAHKSTCTNEKDRNYNLKVYATIRANGGWDAFQIKIHSKFPCQDKIELCIEEERIRKLIGNLNSQRSHLSEEERIERNKALDIKKRIKNPEKYKALGISYRTKNAVVIAEQQKEYNTKNAVVIAEKQKVKYEKNKVETLEKMKETFECECGVISRVCAKSRHERSKPHIHFMKSSEEEKIQIAEKLKDKYTCICGSVFCNTNGAIVKHEKSKKHIQFMETSIK